VSAPPFEAGRTGPSALLSVEDLSVSFATARGRVEAVRGISFEVRPGEIVGIVGESGSGKSVTCRAILGLLPGIAQFSGSIRLEGRELTRLSDEDWCSVRGARIAMIFQNPSSHLDPLRRIGWQVAAPLRRHAGLSRGEALAKATDLLRSVGIREPERAREAYPHQYSGGMKQRAMIAAAIGPAPRLLVADEPTTALDVTVQARILDLLRDLNRRDGLGIVLVSHDLGVVAETCHRVIVMRHGAVVEQGPTQDLIHRPTHAYTKLLLDSQPARRIGLVTDPSSLHHISGRCMGKDREPAGAKPIIAVRDLSVSFATARAPLLSRLTSARTSPVRALDQVSFALTQGETVGIVGESGSGKSTLARTIVNLNRPSSGEVLFEGAPVHDLRGADLLRYRRSVQMIFQNPYESLNPRLTVEEAIAEPLIRHRIVSREEVAATVAAFLSRVELPRTLAGRRPAQLSGGQCQRVGIARALAMNPRLLIADEITSALDVTTQAQVLDLLQRLRSEQGLTLLYISHDLAIVNAVCERVLVFHAGRIVETGRARSVLTDPASAYTRQLIQAIPPLHREAMDRSMSKVE